MTNFNCTRWSGSAPPAKNTNQDSVDSTNALKFVYETIKFNVLNAKPATGSEAAIETKIGARHPTDASDTIDLINHSNGNAVLLFGDWTVNDLYTAHAGIVSPAWALHRPASLRLLGCITANTQAAADAMAQLGHRLPGVAIYGTTVPLYGDDFDAYGLKRGTNYLTTTPHVILPSVFIGDKKSPEPTTLEVVKTWFERFRKADRSLAEATADLAPRARPLIASAAWPQHVEDAVTFTDIVAGYSKHLARAPGLLAEPSLDVFVPVRAGSSDYARVSYFFNGHMIRIYTCSEPDGLIAYRITAKLPAIGTPLPPDSTHLAP